MSLAPAETDAAISGVLGLFMDWKHDTNATIADVLGCTSQTVGRKRRGERSWEAHEVALLAEHYDASPNTFYSGPGALFADTKWRFFREAVAA